LLKAVRERVSCEESVHTGFVRPVGKWSTILDNVGLSVLSEVSKKRTHSRIKVFAALGEVYF